MKILSRFFIVGFFVSILLASCEVDDDGFFQASQVSAILDANVPDTMVAGENYTLEITYQKDSDCHTFSNFESSRQEDSLLFVSAITIFTQAENCNQDAEGVLREVEFSNEFQSNFTFKFLTDVDSDGENVYIDKNVVVIE